jgi:hypothetical protein
VSALPENHNERMTTATLTPAHGAAATTPAGAGQHPTDVRTHRVGGALRAVKVFLTAAFSVAVLGEFTEEAGTKER